ncbi:MAG: hypothetical protein JJE04_23165 [Acidobacteriia bacterium]|nr:hypothetical protein [Terriglobia bacterium]
MSPQQPATVPERAPFCGLPQMSRLLQAAVAAFCFASQCSAADLSAVLAEPNLEKRSEKAIGHAHKALDAARAAYREGDTDQMNGGFDELLRSIELAKKSLDESGKNARKSPKYFKKAEINLRKLNTRMDNFRVEMSVEDRAPIEKIIERSIHIRDEILEAIMGKKK